jgi:hypothetical protein
MTQITLKNHIDQSKLDALLLFLNSWGIEAEINATKVRTAKEAWHLFKKSCLISPRITTHT